MKKILLASMIVFSSLGFAREFEGTMVLKGSLKSKVFINNVETTCRAKVEKVKNILEEDSFGNPGYTIKVNVSLDGNDDKRKIKIKMDQVANLTNFHKVGNKIQASDLNYADEVTGMSLDIDYEGRLKNVKVNYQGQRITCLF